MIENIIHCFKRIHLKLLDTKGAKGLLHFIFSLCNLISPLLAVYYFSLGTGGN